MSPDSFDDFEYERASDHTSEAQRRHYWAVAIGLQDDEVKDFCRTIAFLWQIHPFCEGNARTVAVFSELYLNNLGFQVTNDPFAKHARYYRDALVRAMYRNAPAGVFPDERFLVSFYKRLIGREADELDREKMICTQLFENPSLLRNIDSEEALHSKT